VGEIFERVRPNIALNWTGERLTTDICGQVEIEHLHRYFLARELCRGCDVLDVASGEGYGSALLAQTAKSVVGVEISDNAVAHAVSSYPRSNLRFLQGDARQLPLDPSSVDVVVSFETLEHFFEHDRFVGEVRRVLRPGGRLILSSPERDVYSIDGTAANPYHTHELTRREFEELLRLAFRNVEIALQRPMIGSALFVDRDEHPRTTMTFERRGDNHYEASRGLSRAPYLIAIASDQPLGALPHSVFVETSEVGRTLAQSANAVANDAEKNALAQSIAACNEELESLRRELAGLREEKIATRNEELESLRRELAGLHGERIAHRNEELEDLRQELAGLHGERIAHRNEELEDLRQELANSLEELTAARETLSVVRGQRDALRFHVSRSAQLVAQIATLEVKLGNRKSLIHRLRAEIKRFLRRAGMTRLGGGQ
jgi:SAM-dependent methyltransferase